VGEATLDVREGVAAGLDHRARGLGVFGEVAAEAVRREAALDDACRRSIWVYDDHAFVALLASLPKESLDANEHLGHDDGLH
jgi:hypothetical protein